jgi:transcriptional regulator with XRE-family HTH domain
MSTTPRYRPPAVPDRDLAQIRRSLAHLREQAGLSPERLAEQAGLSRSAVRLIESGRSAPSIGTVYALALALGCRVADLCPGPTGGRKEKSTKS